MSSSQPGSAAAGSMWIPHTTLKITTPEDQNALQSLLPYLAMGFGMVHTEGRGNHTGALHALRKSFNAAQRKIYDKEGITPDWRDYMEEPLYGFEDVVKEHVRKLGHLSSSDERSRIEGLMRQPRSQNINTEQLLCLLEVANTQSNTSFQLGIIRNGFTGRYDANTDAFDPMYVQETELVLPGGKMRNRPVLWIYATNQDERNRAHRIPNQKPQNHFEAIMFANKNQPEYRAHMDRVEQLGVGERLENLFKNRVWKLSEDQTSSDQIGSLKGTFLREVENSEVREHHQYLRAPNGSTGFVNTVRVRAIHPPPRDAPTAETDTKWKQHIHRFRPKTQAEKDDDEARKQILKLVPEDEKEDDEEEPDIVGDLTKINLCRVIPATSRVGNFLDESHPDMNINFFNPGAVVLDTGKRRTKDGTDTARIVRANGKEDVIWLRCLQPLEHPFGLVDRLPLMEPFVAIPEKTSLKDLRVIYKNIHNEEPKQERNKRKLLLDQLNENEPRKRQLLSVFAIRKPSSAAKSNSEVNFEPGEFVLREKPLGGGGKMLGVGHRHEVRDHEGIQGSLNDQDLLPVMGKAAGAWNLCLSSYRLKSNGLFLLAKERPRRPRPKTPPRRQR